MKSAWLSKAVLFSILIISLYACKDKNSTNTTITPTPVGGKGGEATVRVVMENTGLYVDSGWVYVKYNTSVIPSGNIYDDSALVKNVDGTPMAIFTEFKEGNYFFYGKGWDIIRSQTVWGTRPYTIGSDAKKGTSYLILQTTKL